MPLSSLRYAYTKLLIPLSFIIMLLVAYLINPVSFEETWKGRAFYLFFLWLFFLEFIIGDNKTSQTTESRPEWARIAVGTFVLLIPTIYLVEANFFGLNNIVIDWGRSLVVGQGLGLTSLPTWTYAESWPLSFEYMIVTLSLVAAVFILLGYKGLKQFSVSLFLLGAMSAFYTLDTFAPFGNATMLQHLVPYTSQSVAYVLQRLGYAVQMIVLQQDGAVQLFTRGVGVAIYWPCAGVHSLFIYTFVILLFLKGSSMSWAGKVACLSIGALGTFFVNTLRIVSIIDMSAVLGYNVGELWHYYYGEFYFLGWIVIYLFALIFMQRFLTSTRARARASIALFVLGVVLYLFAFQILDFVRLSSANPSFTLPSTQFIVSLSGIILIASSITLGIHTYFIHRKTRTLITPTTEPISH